jgi:hypothetical protein
VGAADKVRKRKSKRNTADIPYLFLFFIVLAVQPSVATEELFTRTWPRGAALRLTIANFAVCCLNRY